MIINKVMIIGVIIKVKMTGMMKLVILVNQIKIIMKMIKINFKILMKINGIKFRKNKMLIKKVVRNKKFKNLRMIFNI